MAENRPMVRRLHLFAGVTPVADIVQWCTENGIDMHDATVNGCHIVYRTPETDEEHALRLARILAADRRTESWEREKLPILAAKYGYELVPKGESDG